MRLKDIAELAGVSISTVSRVLNDRTTTAASQAKQEEIWEIAKQGGYIPNAAAKSLKNSVSQSAGENCRVIYCMLATDPQEYNNDPFYTTLISSIRVEALRHNYIVDYYFYTPSASSVKTAEMMQNQSGCGLIIIGRFNTEILSGLKNQFRNLVYVGLNNINAKCDQVICDGFEAMQSSVKCLYEMGHKNIGFIGAHDDVRPDGFRFGMKKCGLSVQPPFLVDNIILSMDGGYDGMNRILDARDAAHSLSAVVCANDTTAIGALRACKERGVKVPEDVSIIGMIDIEMLRALSPTLSTVHIPLEEMGSMTVKLLVDRIEGGHRNNLKISFPFWVVSRESIQSADE